MRVTRFDNLDDLSRLAADWDRLAAGNPFRSWAWQSTWWRHYRGRESRRGCPGLYVLGVFDDADRLVGVAPWHARGSPVWGRVLEFLGTGEICSEYLGVLAGPDREEAVAGALAQWLVEKARGADRWDRLELSAVDAEDRPTLLLVDAIRARGLLVHSRPGPPCWRIELPETWPDFLQMLSRNHRKRIRHAENQMVKSGRAVFHLARRVADLARGREVLIDLHQRRRQRLGEPGCFASHRFTAFHREVMPLLLVKGQLQLYWVEIDGKPAVAEYLLSGGEVVYCYQSGLDPDAMHLSPGQLGNMMGIRHAIGQGCRAFDFLRGDEAYKAHWRAAPRATLEFRAAAPRRAARLRLRLWLAKSRLKRWLKEHPRPAVQAGHDEGEESGRPRADGARPESESPSEAREHALP